MKKLKDPTTLTERILFRVWSQQTRPCSTSDTVMAEHGYRNVCLAEQAVELLVQTKALWRSDDGRILSLNPEGIGLLKSAGVIG